MRTEALDRGRDKTRERILTAASDLFSRAGFEATTVKEIAREAQLTDPALYYYFPSKRDILAALLQSPPIHDLRLQPHARPTREALIEDLCAIFDFWSGHAGLLRLVYSHALDGDESTRAFGETLAATYEQLIFAPLREIFGPAAERIYGAVLSLLIGVQLDALIEFGAGYEAHVATPAFRARLSRLISHALPQPQPQVEAV
jgi:AcrR family transcriptional regulator